MHKPFFSLRHCNSYFFLFLCISKSFASECKIKQAWCKDFAMVTCFIIWNFKFSLIPLLIYTNLGDHLGCWKSVCLPIHIHTNDWWLLKVATYNHKDAGLFHLWSDVLICMEYIAWSFMTPNAFPEKQNSPNSPWLIWVLFSFPALWLYG